jgi:hypothetical protein
MSEAATPAVDIEALKSSLGVLNQDETVENAFARVLLLGPAKAGKTTAIVGTAPQPLVINCDGIGATKGAKNVYENSTFDVVDAHTRAGLKQACVVAEKLVAAGHTKTIVLDTVTLLADSLLDEITVTLSGWDVWTELENVVMAALKRLSKLPCHLFVIAHMNPAKDPTEGIMPAIGGKLKTRLPAYLDDWVLLDVDPDRKPERAFLLGPQKTWTHSGRNIRRKCVVEATVPALLGELGVAL